MCKITSPVGLLTATLAPLLFLCPATAGPPEKSAKLLLSSGYSGESNQLRLDAWLSATDAIAQPVPASDSPVAWSKPVNGLQARLCFARKETFNGTPIITTYLELRNVSENASPLELPFDPPDFQTEFSVSDAAGKAVSPAKGPFRELRADLGVLRIPFDSLLRVNIAHRGAAVPKDCAAHLDLGADAAIDGIADAPAVWDFKRGDKQEYYLQAKLTVKKKDRMQWAGTIVIAKVKLPTSGSGAVGDARKIENARQNLASFGLRRGIVGGHDKPIVQQLCGT